METAHIRDLTPDPVNRRQHNPRNVGMLVDALQKVGASRSIVVDEDGVILAGNGVVEAASEAGITKLQIVEADGETLIAVRRRGLTPSQKRELAIYDNRTAELATWNVEQLTADLKNGEDLSAFFFDDELKALLKGSEGAKAGLTDPDDVPDERPTGIVAGDLFALGAHRLLCGDSVSGADVARLMADGRADCVFTSPPYGVGVDYGTYDDTIENLRAMLPLLAARWLDVVLPGGFAVINFGDIASGREAADVDEVCEYPMAVEYWPAFRHSGWVLWSRRIWCKPNPRVSSLQCIGSNRAATDWEHIWSWKAPGQALVSRVNGDHQSAIGWFDTSLEHGVDVGKSKHGAGMAVAPAVRMIAIHSHGNAIVHEPFTGTGTTMIAAHQLSRRCYGCEIEPRYVQMAIDRWEAFTGQKAQKVGEAVHA